MNILSCMIAAAPVDLEHLARYTGGDAALNAEILGLFDGQIGGMLPQLGDAGIRGDRKTWHDIAHSIKGAARGIGAFAFADEAAKAEAFDPATDTGQANAIFAALRREGDSVSQFIKSYLAR